MHDGEGYGERTLRLAAPIDLRQTLSPLRRGSRDPCMRIGPGGIWRASRTPEGPVTLHLRAEPAQGAVHAYGWGPGTPWALDGLADLVGANDDGAPLAALLEGRPSGDNQADSRRVVRDMHRRLPGLRIPRSRAVVEALVPTILEQKVVGRDARRSYRQLVTEMGTRAPGPPARLLGLMLPPDPSVLATTPSWAWHRYGVERKRADTIRAACTHARRMEEATRLPLVDARRRLTALGGLGAWTAAEVALVALGDPDAVSVGDYHLPDQVAWALAGRPRADDATMLEMLEPYRGQRGRVIRMITASGIVAPRRGPRAQIRSFRSQ